MSRHIRSGRALAALGAALAAALTAAVASAQEDGPRFRGGVALEGGAIIAPGGGLFGGGGIQGQLGVQINDRWAIYALPSLGVFAGGGLVFSAGSALLAELTLPGVPISIAVGPEADALWVPGGDASAGSAFGGRLRFAVHPVIVRPYGGPRRRALSLGVDLRVSQTSFGGADSTAVAFVPTAWIGYTAF